MTEDQPLTDLSVPDSALAKPMSVRTAKADRQDLEQDFPMARLSHGKLHALQGARAGKPDGRRGGRAQEAASTAGLTVSMSFSMVSRS